jgi:hypothetical protein
VSLLGEAPRVPNLQKARLRDYHFDLLYAGGAMIDAPPADSFNPNKEIDFDSP